MNVIRMKKPRTEVATEAMPERVMNAPRTESAETVKTAVEPPKKKSFWQKLFG